MLLIINVLHVYRIAELAGCECEFGARSRVAESDAEGVQVQTIVAYA